MVVFLSYNLICLDECAFGDAEQEDDAGEEKKLLAILLKLKAAKASVSNSKKRKHCERVVEDQLVKYQCTVRDVLSKFSSKRGAAFKRLRANYGALGADLTAARKAVEANRMGLRARLKQRCDEAGVAAARLEQCARNDVACLRTEHEQALTGSREYAHDQVQYKLGQLEEWVAKLDSGSKQDKLSTLIQTVLATF